jgi:CheY-like chemotaxis protein
MPKILILDDQPDSVKALRFYLGKRGHEVELVADQSEALCVLLERTPDVLVLDLLMPRIDGSMLLEVIRSYRRFSQLPVIVLTALATGPLIDKVMSLCPWGVFIKGRHTLEEIAGGIESACRSSPPSQSGMQPARGATEVDAAER